MGKRSVCGALPEMLNYLYQYESNPSKIPYNKLSPWDYELKTAEITDINLADIQNFIKVIWGVRYICYFKRILIVKFKSTKFDVYSYSLPISFNEFQFHVWYQIASPK